MKHTKIAIIGAGSVGATTAYAILLQGITAELLLVDVNDLRCKGEMYDLCDAIPFSKTSKVRQATTQEAAQADIIIITAGLAQKPGQTRRELLEANKEVLSAIFAQLKPLNKEAIIIIVTNPVDVLTFLAQKLSGLPHNQVFGSGTFLDSQRLRGLISQKIGIAEQSIHAYVIGEHGDTQFPVWSSAQIGGMPLIKFPQLDRTTLELIAQETRKKAYEIIVCKGATFFGIAACMSAICENIIFNRRRVLPLSCYNERLGVYLSMPVVLGESGIEQILPVSLDQEEQEKLAFCVEKLKSANLV